VTDTCAIEIDIPRQTLTLRDAGRVLSVWPVSTARNGAGERMHSGCTPRGRHRVRLLIGAGCKRNSVFVGRRATGEIYSEALSLAQPQRDWILTRIIWLTGCEPGFNRGGDCDTLRRFIYIHGCPDSEPMGIPMSHGCVRMRNDDVIDLFDRVQVGTPVTISDGTTV
jgi:hypothetical protein